MALIQTDILAHNNPNLAVVDGDFTKGGFRTAVADINGLFALSGKTDEPSAAGQLKEFATVVYVSGESKYYILKDINNVANINGWTEFVAGGGTITGGTNGLSTDGANIVLGGDLLSGTTITILSGASLTIEDLRTSPVGIQYDDDYTTTFTEESLVTKRYVDAVASGLVPKAAVLVATTPSDGNLLLSGLTETVDGVTLISGDRVLVKNQTDPIENGIYIATGGTWTRALDFDGSPQGEVATGNLVPVESGTLNSDTIWTVISPNPIVVDTDPIEFTLFLTPKEYTEGTGIDITGTVISVDGSALAGNGIIWSGDTFNVDTSIIDYPITGATNGLEVVGKDVYLGGSAIQSSATISLCNGANFSVGCNTVGGYLNVAYGAAPILDNVKIRYANTGTSEIGMINIWNAEGNIEFNSSLSGATCQKIAYFNYLSGFTYAACYHGDFSDRSLVDKEYVDIAISAATSGITGTITGATNGLSVDGADIKLGGNPLIESTTINSSGFDFTITNMGTDVCIQPNYISSYTSGGTGIVIDGTSGLINLTGMIGIITTPADGGFDDYVLLRADDAGEVKRMPVLAITSGITSTALTGATNGLTATGQVVCLGGAIDYSCYGGELVIGSNFGATPYQIFACYGTNVYGNYRGIGTTYVGVDSSDDCQSLLIQQTGLGGDNVIQLYTQTGMTEAKGISLYSKEGNITLTHYLSGITTYSDDYISRMIHPNHIPSVGYVTGYTQSAITENSNVVNVFNVTGSSYTATTVSEFIGVSGATDIYLPHDPKEGQRISVADICGNALADNITIWGYYNACGKCINGDNFATITTDYGSITFINNGIFWSAVSFIN